MTLANKKVAVITGGAMGIGAEAASALASDGHHVIICDINTTEAERFAQQLRDQGFSADALQIDVGTPASVSAAFEWIEAKFGRCDVLVNSAGIAKTMPFLEFDADVFNRTMLINVTGTFLCCQLAARIMRKHEFGRIINIASVAGMRAVGKGRTAYGTSKGAVIALTRQMAVELSEYGITANAIAPGPVDTPMTKELHSDEFRKAYSNAIPAKRYGTTREIAGAVSYLASDVSAYVNGIVLPVDGGFLAWGAGDI
ncbi:MULTISPECIES: SDR family NAD(P)-dependent oxidoreductase [Pseudomonas]|jgi:NAD(P)-dependent dehydrogenase (short-subunit alcohol dehydrogenase family)|uniref:SDR family NAD(P)-dependent oxidoreductase n=1 Tax=Pseudomonas TaxID=286 RepID=UPI000908E31C|nr:MULTISPECIES: 3-oxoacyl-ACP reductase family protein [Pseudomonas]TCV68208.1 NAD(P)-dependent dehydrogenase (short-subunit alcohol dehydrogenase family) [Pseudomonas fluorescens]SFW47789.1 NAD(P)-dependent dehydrogenase, short-chain alcohol dehydrogenase family [Pseudomonas sp. NFACC04-2]